MMMELAQKRLQAGSSGRSGFTLMEASIVLAVSGIILAAIWGAAYAAYMNYYVGKAKQEYLTVSQTLKTMAGGLETSLSTTGSIGNGYFYAGDVTDSLMKAGVFPSDMVDRQNNAVVNPWTVNMVNFPNAVVITAGTYAAGCGFSIPAGAPPEWGSFGCANPPAGSPVNSFEILFNGIPTDACIQLAMHLGGNIRDNNIMSIFINDWSAGHGIQSFPITAQQAAGACDPNNNMMGGPGPSGSGFYGGSNSIDVVYRFM